MMMIKGGSRIGEREAEVEAPQGVGFAEGVSPSPAPSPEIFLNFYPEMAHFCAFCNLQQ